jgi:transcriptional regulator with GAF, ATPase, and Fis domain
LIRKVLPTDRPDGDGKHDLGSTLSIVDGRRRTPGAPSPQPHLFLALECMRPLAPSARFGLATLDEVVIGRGTARGYARVTEGDAKRLVVRVPDPWMSATHATLIKVFGRWVLEDANSKNGTVLNGESHKRAFLGDGDLIELGHTFFLYRDGLMTAPEEPLDLESSQLEGRTPGMATLVPQLGATLRRLEQVARSGLAIVLCGESGTGKEVLARAAHAMSGRGGAFVAVNCGALPETLVETELFGYRKGAFSGAAEDRPGLIRAADKGTLFLDEIGDLPLPSQAAFLRVLQEREVVPVGGTRPVPVDVRLVAATHRDLDQLVAEGRFRDDLFARVSGLKILLPPLRERREDLGLLTAALLQRVAGEAAGEVTFDARAARAMFRYRWPMNIRELEKALTAAVVLAGDNPIESEHLPPAVASALVAAGGPREGSSDASDAVNGRDDSPGEGPGEGDEGEDDRPLSEQDLKRRDELIALLREHRGNVSQVARVMGKARMQIQRWIKRYKLDPEAYRSR